MRTAILLSIFACGLFYSGNSIAVQENVSNNIIDYHIQLSAKQISRHQVEFNVKTNIPLPVEVMASVNLENQKPDDLYIGYSYRITLQDTNQTFVLNTQSKNLPNGNYSADISFYPRWGANNGNPKARNIKNTIKKSFKLLLQNGNQTVASVKQKNEKQLWVIENVIIGTLWNKKIFVEKLGNYQELTVANKNQTIINAYYFHDADITIFVNSNKNNIVTWRMGETSSL